MYIVLYRWRLKPGMETQFCDAWSEVTAHYRENSGSLGSRLHRGNDGLYYGYAKWRSAADREHAFSRDDREEAGDRMRDAVDKSLPPVELDVLADFWINE